MIISDLLTIIHIANLVNNSADSDSVQNVAYVHWYQSFGLICSQNWFTDTKLNLIECYLSMPVS